QADAPAKAQIVAAVKAKSSEVEIADVKEGATVSDTPRVALAAYGDNRPTGLIAAGTVNTTAKGSRPRPQDARVHRTPTVVPVAATPTQRVLSSHSVISSRPETPAPDFNIRLAEAPQAVYTAGFEQKNTPVT